MSRLVQRQHIQYALQRRSLGYFQPANSHWERIFQQAKASVQGSQQQKTQIIKQRIRLYFAKYSQINIEQNAYPENTPDYSNPFLIIKKESLILYGTDLMSTRRVEQYFGSFFVNVEWINDSHCKVTFQNQNTALNAIISNATDQVKKWFSFNSENIEKIEKKWFELNPYYQLCFQRKLKVRFATNLDVIECEDKNKKTVFYNYIRAKQSFIRSVCPNQNLNSFSYKSNYRRMDSRSSRSQYSRSHSRDSSRQNMSHGNKYGRSYGFNGGFREYSRSRNKNKWFNGNRAFNNELSYHDHKRYNQNYERRNFHMNFRNQRRYRNMNDSNSYRYNNGYKRNRFNSQSSMDLAQMNKIKKIEKNFQKYIRERDNSNSENSEKLTQSLDSRSKLQFGKKKVIKQNQEKKKSCKVYDNNDEARDIEQFEKFMRGMKLDDSQYSQFEVTNNNMNIEDME